MDSLPSRRTPSADDNSIQQINGGEELIRNKRRRYTRDLSAVKVDGQVGSGVYGTVFKARDPVTDELLALKMIKMSKEKDGFPVTAIREIKILKALNHENIIHLHEILTYNTEASENSTFNFEDGAVFMVFDYMDFDLSGLMSSNFTLTPNHIRSYTKQILSGMHYIHKNNILHRDIKGANILVSRDNRVKIADWGLSRSFYSSAQRLSNPVVTLWYRSPELLLETRTYGPEIDIWSVGCLFGEMMGRPPRPILAADPPTSQAQLEMIYKLCGTPTAAAAERLKRCEGWDKYQFSATYPYRLRERFASLPLHAVDLLDNLLNLNPDSRVTAAAALDHSYFWSEGTLPPDRLPPIRVEGAHEYETIKRKQEGRARQQQQVQQQQQRGPVGGRGVGVGGGRGGSGRSKFRVVRDPRQQAGRGSAPPPPPPVPATSNLEEKGNSEESTGTAFKKAPTAVGYVKPPSHDGSNAT